jgi:hypothetical protein
MLRLVVILEFLCYRHDLHIYNGVVYTLPNESHTQKNDYLILQDQPKLSVSKTCS